MTDDASDAQGFNPQGVLFDCDSTLCAFEGIDALAAKAGCQAEIAALTHAAMEGQTPLEAVYEKRLQRIAPTQAEVQALSAQYLARLTSGALETITALKNAGRRVGIVSGGLKLAILPVARALGIEEKDVFAVDLVFDADGNYASVAPTPLTTAAGKYAVVAQWKREQGLSQVALIGDGMSDVAALGEGGADKVIGFGGVIAREKVRQTASVFVEKADLRAVLPYLGLAPAEEG